MSEELRRQLELQADRTHRWRMIALDLMAPHSCPEHSRALVDVSRDCLRCRGEGAFKYENEMQRRRLHV